LRIRRVLFGRFGSCSTLRQGSGDGFVCSDGAPVDTHPPCTRAVVDNYPTQAALEWGTFLADAKLIMQVRLGQPRALPRVGVTAT
jgi:hypothetical protein